MLKPSTSPDSPRRAVSGTMGLKTLALAVSLAIHGAVIGILEKIDTEENTSSLVAVKEDPEKTLEVLNRMQAEEVEKIFKKLSKGEESEVLDYIKFDAIQSKIAYYKDHPKFLEEEEINEKIITEVTALNKIFTDRIQKLADNPSLNWTGDVRKDFPTLQRALYLEKERLFLNKGQEETWYQKDAWSFTGEFMDGIVNCQSARVNSLVLRLIYEKKGLPTTDLERLKALVWVDHIASVYEGEDGYTQLQGLDLEHPLKEGLRSPITGQEGTVVDLREHMANYLSEQKDLNPVTRAKALSLRGKTLAKFLDQEMPEVAFPLHKNPAFYKNVQQGTPTALEKPEIKFETAIASAKGQMRYQLLREITETYKKNSGRNLQLLEEPEWVKDEASQEIVLQYIGGEVERILVYGCMGSEELDALYAVLHLQLNGPKNPLTEILDEKVKTAENPTLNLLRSRSIGVGDEALDLTLWDRISEREDFKENWERILEKGVSENDTYYSLNLKYYKYVSQYLNMTKHFGFDIQAIEQHLDPRKDKVELLTSFDINQMTDKEKLDVLKQRIWRISYYAGSTLENRETLYAYIKDQISRESKITNHSWDNPYGLWARLSQDEVNRDPSNRARYLELWLPVVEAEDEVHYDSDIDFPFLKEAREKSVSRLKYKKSWDAEKRARIEALAYPKIIKDFYYSSEPLEYTQSDLEMLDTYKNTKGTDELTAMFYSLKDKGIDEKNKKALKDLYEKLTTAERRKFLELSSYSSVNWLDKADLYQEDLTWINRIEITKDTPVEEINLKLKYAAEKLSIEECTYAIALGSKEIHSGIDEERALEISTQNALTHPEWLRKILLESAL